jgi:hypothetical protein
MPSSKALAQGPGKAPWEHSLSAGQRGHRRRSCRRWRPCDVRIASGMEAGRGLNARLEGCFPVRSDPALARQCQSFRARKRRRTCRSRAYRRRGAFTERRNPMTAFVPCERTRPVADTIFQAFNPYRSWPLFVQKTTGFMQPQGKQRNDRHRPRQRITAASTGFEGEITRFRKFNCGPKFEFFCVIKRRRTGCGKSEKPIVGPSEPVSEPQNRALNVSDGKPSSKVTRPFHKPKYSVVELK